MLILYSDLFCDTLLNVVVYFGHSLQAFKVNSSDRIREDAVSVNVRAEIY